MSKALAMFSIYDQKAESHFTPFFAVNQSVALRIFSQAVNDPTTTFYAHPADFNLFEIGAIALDDASIVDLQPKINLGSGLAVKVNELPSTVQITPPETHTND